MIVLDESCDYSYVKVHYVTLQRIRVDICPICFMCAQIK